MITKPDSLPRYIVPTALLAGIFAAASAHAQVATPVFSPAAGVYSRAQSVTIASATSGASIAYTTDGSIPAENASTITHGALYSGAVSINATTTLSAIAFENGHPDSAVAVGGYTLQPTVDPAGGMPTGAQPMIITPAITQLAAPAFGPAPGTYSQAVWVTITSNINGANIRYTTDGSTPTETNGTVYDSDTQAYLNGTATLKAIAYLSGYTDSPVTSGLYTINLIAAPGLNVLYNFPASNGGANPYAGLTKGSDGNFYGTTVFGGTNNGGTVFKTTPSGTVTTLASFSSTTGAEPFGGVVQGTDGNFYGTAYSGGIPACGTIFKMTPAGGLTALVSFSLASTNAYFPLAGLVQGTDGNFYGTGTNGGSSFLGAIFKVTPAGSMTTLASFTGANGNKPMGCLVQGSDGNFYGTTQLGGSTFVPSSNSGSGTVFKMTPAGALTTLVSFTGANGQYPGAGLILGNDGNFYGTTEFGGTNDDGTVFRMTPAGTLTTLASFNGNNGAGPLAGLIQGSDGNFYGMAASGILGNGVVFRITPAGVLTALAAFNGANGDLPTGGLVQGSDGNFYGMGSDGGTADNGVIFQLIIPSSVAAPVFSLAAGTFASAQTVTITTTTSGAAIAYTTDGSTPTEAGGVVTNGTLYSGGISISATTTVKAIAFESGQDSAVTSGAYTINIPAPTPPPTPPAGGGGGGGAPSYGFLGLLAIAGILRWKFRKNQAV